MHSVKAANNVVVTRRAQARYLVSGDTIDGELTLELIENLRGPARFSGKQ